MEQLAKTCKILYDKDYLDSKKRLKENDIYAKVKYSSWKEYETLCEEFKSELPTIIRKYRMDKWTYMHYGIEEKFGLQLSCQCEIQITKLLSKLTKNQNKKWVDYISNIIGSIIRGIAKSISMMNHLGDDLQSNFKNREMCNIIITNMINTLLFENEDVQEGYEMEKIRTFVCKKCKKEDNSLIGEDEMYGDFETEFDEMCFDCYEQEVENKTAGEREARAIENL